MFYCCYFELICCTVFISLKYADILTCIITVILKLFIIIYTFISNEFLIVNKHNYIPHVV